jgi:Cu2+-containing amine oxidase
METAWKVEWETRSGYGLIIKNAFFKRGPQEEWVQVLGDTRVSEIFQAYDRGSPRFWDVSYGFDLATLREEDAPNGKLHTCHNGSHSVPCVAEEVRDRGIIYRTSQGKVRRGEVLALWACLNAANYQNIIEYGFQDDGTIMFRFGATGEHFSGSECDPFMHSALWRIQVNLDGPKNRVYLVEHRETPDGDGRAQTVQTPFNNDVEGCADWEPTRFTMLRVVNEGRKNAQDKPWSYDLIPSRMGTARHYGGDRRQHEEDCTLHDFWVTRANAQELSFKELPRFIANKECIKDADVVLWHSSPIHREPRSEDGVVVDNRLQGCTHVIWSTFMLRPNNLFDRTPFYPYPEKQAQENKAN